MKAMENDKSNCLKKTLCSVFCATTLFIFAVSGSAAAGPLETLRADVARIAKTLNGDVGASVAILGDNPIPLINGDKRFPFMSTVKTLVAIQALKRVEEGKFSLDQQITILPEDLTVMTPISMTFPEGPTTTSLHNLRDLFIFAYRFDNNQQGKSEGMTKVEMMVKGEGMEDKAVEEHAVKSIQAFCDEIGKRCEIKK